jgi:hypothetical protein
VAGTIIADVIQSDQSYPSSINIASPVIISNTFAFPAGTVSAPAFFPTGDTNTGIFFPAADTIAFTEGGVEAMRIDSSGNVGIGTNSPVSAAGFNILTLDGSTSGALYLRNNGTSRFRALSDSSAAYLYAMASTALLFGSGDTERMRITSVGNVGIGTASPGNARLRVEQPSGLFESTHPLQVWAYAQHPIVDLYLDSGGAPVFNTDASSIWNPTSTMVWRFRGTERMRLDATGRLLVGTTTARGGITVDTTVSHTTGATFAGAGGNQAWTTGFTSQALTTGIQTTGVIQAAGVYSVSDIRLKEAVSSIPSGLGFIADITPVEFDWKADKTKDTGYIAQDLLAKGYGHLVSAIPDAPMEEVVHEDGNVSPAGMRFVAKYDSVVPILHRAIQELKAELDSVKTELAILKGN